ncbi:MAG TPA: cupin-like domain-containing protein [Thermoanaerobaculia bacterium]|nr:cupin-like domain-containing protein [Thermoanaerobaculia bacterium]
MAWKVRRTGAAEVPFRIKGKVGRIEDPPPAVFFRKYVEANRPVVLSGVMEPWPALGRWNPAYLESVAGEHTGEVIVSKNGLYPDYISQPPPMAKVEMRLSEFLRRAVPPENQRTAAGEPPPPILAPGETYYIYGKSYLLDAFPALREEIGAPACLGDVPVSTNSVWFSSPGCVTPLHYDLPNGLLCQVLGSKQVYLFDPSQHDLLYPRGRHFPGFDNFERQSQVDIQHPDFGAFPEFRRAEALECTLRQGDTLFIPSNWFHEVETLELSISVGFGFAGGTSTSELAALSELFKKLSGGAPGAVNGMDLFRRAGEGPSGGPTPNLASDPRLMEELMSSPSVQRLLQDPAMMESVVRIMTGASQRS